MNEEKHIDYSAADIERYHKGLMTAKERHALEKAALDDPFLADAIEGYGNTSIDTNGDIASLDKKLDERIGKVIPLKKKGFTWLRVAAVFILLAGAGLLTYNYFLVSNKNEVASATEKDKAAAKDTAVIKMQQADTVKNSVAATENKSSEATTLQKEVQPKNDKENKKDVLSVAKQKSATKQKTTDEELESNANAAPQQDTYDVAAKNENAIKRIPDTVQHHLQAESTAANAKDKNLQPQKKAYALKESAAARGIAAQNNQTRLFRGQVMDQNNSPLPFANVTIVPDNIGTYTDVKGNFTLISPDSTLNVQVRSVGFEDKRTTLQTARPNNSIVLEQDTKNIPSTVISNRNVNSERKRMDNNMKLEEPEPADGWYNYDTYIANNIKISDEIKMKTDPSSEVDLSFDVNEFGEPVNIKVEKSVCKECDAEAIRLLKEGPKWKKNKKNKRAKVSVAFQ